MAKVPFRLLAGVALAFLATLLLGAFLIYLNDRNQVLQNREAAMEVASTHGHLLQEQLYRSLSATYALAAVLRQGKGEIDNFEVLAGEMLGLYGGISALQLARRGIITRTVPLHGNEAALGHNLLADPKRNKEAYAAVESKKLTLAGPFVLVQGGFAVVGRLPVFLPDQAGREEFWGFTTAVIRIPDLLTVSKLDARADSDYDFELSRRHPDSGERDVFASSSPLPLDASVSYQIEVPNGNWTLSLARIGGWHARPTVLAVQGGLVLVVGILVALFTYYVLKQPYVLRQTVKLRTQDLSAANRRLEAEIIERRHADDALRENMAEIQIILGTLSDGVIAVDPGCRVRYANTAARSLLGMLGEAIEGRALDGVLKLVSERTGKELEGLCPSVIRDGAPIHLRGDIRIRTTYGQEFDAKISAVPAPGSGDVAMILVFTDISAEIGKERQIEFQAFHDPLTELGNRSMLARDLAPEIERAAREGSRIAVLSLDLDNFKNINDALGHTIGDILLKQLAQRLRAVVVTPAWATRHGGDEFIVVLPRCAAVSQASRLAERLMESIAQPFAIEEHELRVTSSIGISLYPDHGLGIGELISNADMAMYEAKRAGRNAYRFYEMTLLYRSAERLAMENGLRVALAEKQFALVFQPKVTIATEQVHAVEALLRWHRGAGESIPPATFIPVAEDSGLIIDIGEWVLRESLVAARRLRSVLGREIAVAVNVSPIQFRSERLFDSLRELAQAEPDLPQLLEIELTESALAGKLAEVTAKLDSIKRLGLKIAIDDFGTGYSSLAYLKNFPIDILKIDQAFIRDLHSNPQDKAIVGSVVQLGKSLGFEIVAEGVEEAQHVAILAELGCDYAQGYWFARPLAEPDLVVKLGGVLPAEPVS